MEGRAGHLRPVSTAPIPTPLSGSRSRPVASQNKLFFLRFYSSPWHIAYFSELLWFPRSSVTITFSSDSRGCIFLVLVFVSLYWYTLYLLQELGNNFYPVSRVIPQGINSILVWTQACLNMLSGIYFKNRCWFDWVDGERAMPVFYFKKLVSSQVILLCSLVHVSERTYMIIDDLR